MSDFAALFVGGPALVGLIVALGTQGELEQAS